MDYLVAASRGGGLTNQIPYKVTAAVIPGGTLDDMAEKAAKLLPPPPQFGDRPHVYVMAGICDITYKVKSGHGPHRYTECLYSEEPSLTIERVKNEINNCARKIEGAGAVPCFCTIVPSSIKGYNNHLLNIGKTTKHLHTDKYASMQRNLELAINEINSYIIDTNHSRNMSTPLTHTSIRKRHGTKPRHYYKYDYRQLKDGVHGNASTRTKWAAALQGAIKLNRYTDNSDEEPSSPRRSWRRERPEYY